MITLDPWSRGFLCRYPGAQAQSLLGTAGIALRAGLLQVPGAVFSPHPP